MKTITINGESRIISNFEEIQRRLTYAKANPTGKWVPVYVHSADGKTPNAACHSVPARLLLDGDKCFTGGDSYQFIK